MVKGDYRGLGEWGTKRAGGGGGGGNGPCPRPPLARREKPRGKTGGSYRNAGPLRNPPPLALRGMYAPFSGPVLVRFGRHREGGGELEVKRKGVGREKLCAA
jgi:hypothetical protein